MTFIAQREAAMDSPSTRPELTHARRRAVLIVMCLALMTVVSAVASLNVGLPDLARGTHASQSQLQWRVHWPPRARSDGPRVRAPARRRRARPRRVDVDRALLEAVPRDVRGDALRLPDDA